MESSFKIVVFFALFVLCMNGIAQSSSTGEKPVKSSPESALESIRICYRHISA